MNAKLSRQMTFLGLGVLAFYAGLLGTGQASLEILPQFAISAVIFLSSGKIMRQIADKLPTKERADEQEQEEPNWELRNLVLNWLAAATVVTFRRPSSTATLSRAKPSSSARLLMASARNCSSCFSATSSFTPSRLGVSDEPSGDSASVVMSAGDRAVFSRTPESFSATFERDTRSRLTST